MIDTTTGSISIDNLGITVGPLLTRTEFLASSIGRHATICVENPPYRSYDATIPAGDLMSLPAILSLYFHDQKLASINLTASDNRFGASWRDWSEEKELERKRFHDRWLADTIPAASRDFKWGELSSEYDPKSGCSSIHLRYS